MTNEKDVYEVTFDVATGIEKKVLVEKEVIAKELAANEIRIADRLKNEEETIAARVAAEAKLATLGLTAEDLKALGL
jgi:hypothetical protein